MAAVGGGQIQKLPGTALDLDHGRMYQELAMLCVRGQTDRVLEALMAAPTEELISRGCEVNAKDSKHQTPLQVACAESHAEVVLELLLARADANAADQNQQTALHKAVMAGASAEVLQVLMDQGGADPSLADGTKTTPLLLAAARGRTDQLECLLAKDANLISACNDSGWTALHLAAHGRESKRNSINPAKFPAAVKLLLAAKAEPNAQDEDRKTALHRAATSGNSEAAAALIEGGADVMAEDNCRWLPLHYACQDGHIAVAKLLLKSGAAVQRENPPCLTPLALATIENQVAMAELLLNEGADPNLRGKGLASPIMIARKDKDKFNDILALFELGFVKH